MNAAHTFGQQVIPFSSPMHVTPAEPPHVGDQILKGGRRAVVTHVETDRDNPRSDVVVCATYIDTGTDATLFWSEIDVTFRR
jgi:hypothetical protein